VARRLRISYGSIVTGSAVGSSALTLDGVHSFRRDDESFDLSASFVLTTPDGVSADANFATDCATVEAALQVPDQALLVQILDTSGSVSATLVNLSPANNSALGLSVTLDKSGSAHDTIRSRRWTFTASGGLPSLRDVGGDSAGLRELSILVAFDSSCRGELTMAGTYTAAAGGLAASARYLALIPARTAAVTSALGGTWALLRHEFETDDLDQVCTFRRVLREIIFSESESALDHPAITDQQLKIQRILTGANGARDDNALQRFVATYQAAVCKDVTTDMGTLFADVVRPHLLSQLRLTSGGEAVAVMSEDIDADVANVLSVTIEAVARGGGDVLRSSQTVSVAFDFGQIFRDVWAETGVSALCPTPAYVFQGSKTIIRTTTLERTQLGLVGVIVCGGGGEAGTAGGEGTQPGAASVNGASDSEWILTHKTATSTPRTMGMPDGDQVDVTDVVTVLVERQRAKVTRSEAGGGQPPTPAPSGGRDNSPTGFVANEFGIQGIFDLNSPGGFSPESRI
jgi:hypothetical protein